jgi:hypothetical protein
LECQPPQAKCILLLELAVNGHDFMNVVDVASSSFIVYDSYAFRQQEKKQDLRRAEVAQALRNLAVFPTIHWKALVWKQLREGGGVSAEVKPYLQQHDGSDSCGPILVMAFFHEYAGRPLLEMIGDTVDYVALAHQSGVLGCFPKSVKCIGMAGSPKRGKKTSRTKPGSWGVGWFGGSYYGW